MQKKSKIDEVNSKQNIDYYHMYRVNDAITNWFEENNISVDEEKEKEFKNILLNKVKFIWYEIEKEDAIKVFTRLNIGKIPLTDAELVKALFLNRSYYNMSDKDADKKRLEIASDWDKIECTLQNDEFWMFIHDKGYDKPTRIDFILDIIRKKDKENGNKYKNDEHATFRYFFDSFSEKAKDKTQENDWISNEWQKVKKYFQIFNEWYNDYRLYHYIGYLIDNDYTSINNLIDIWEGSIKGKGKTNDAETKTITKSDFVSSIMEIIKKKVFDNEWAKNLDNYLYDEDKAAKSVCRPILLLHNIETIIQQNDELIKKAEYGLPNFTRFLFICSKKKTGRLSTFALILETVLMN